MSAATSFDLSGTGIDAGPRPVWIPRWRGDKSPRLVSPRYLLRAHRNEELKAVVTHNGEPIVANGEVLTVELVPPWRRYAIGPAVDGRAELLDQRTFEREEELNYLEYFTLRGERPDDSSKRYIPNVKTFVSWKIDTMRAGFECPLGTYIGPQAVKEGEKQYDAVNDKLVSKQVDETIERMRAEIADRDERMARLEAMIEKMSGVKVAEKSAPPLRVSAKCGKEIDPRYMSQHIRMCKKGCREEHIAEA